MVVVPAFAQASGITSPAFGDTLSGIVLVEGTANHPNFLRYELAFLAESSPNRDWIVFAEGGQSILNGTLAIWDTTVGRNIGAAVFPDGRYQLRLRVVRQDYNYDEYFVTNLTISNDQATPTPTLDPAITVTVSAVATPTAVNPLLEVRPTVLPSLTPFPTPTQLALAENAGTPPNPNASVDSTESQPPGILGQLAAIDTSQFSQAFWQGVQWVTGFFGLMGLYLILRGMGRWLRRFLVHQLRTKR